MPVKIEPVPNGATMGSFSWQTVIPIPIGCLNDTLIHVLHGPDIGYAKGVKVADLVRRLIKLQVAEGFE